MCVVFVLEIRMAGEEEGPTISIESVDLETTYSCAVVWQRDRVEIITNE